MEGKLHTTLPNDPIFAQLLQTARKVNHVIVHDAENEVNANYSQFITDILETRGSLQEPFEQSDLDRNGILAKGNSPYIFILSEGNYEFIVAAFSILAIGGAVVPLSPRISAQEAFCLMQRCQSTTILASKSHIDLAKGIREHAKHQATKISLVPILFNILPTISLKDESITLNLTSKLSPDLPALLLFTSGTSGPPKGVVHTRTLFHDIHKASGPNEVFLHHRPPNWITGVLPLFRHPLAGARLEVISDRPEVIWERLKRGGVTMLIGPTRFWGTLMNYFLKTIASNLEKERVREYVVGAREVRTTRVGGTMPHSVLLKFWREDIGIELQLSYGATELGGRGLRTRVDTDMSIGRCVGRPQPGVLVRLSEGDEGEVEVKSPYLFKCYLSDEAATRAAFTSDGYYRTGDLAHRVGKDYVFDGRIGDFIKFQGYKISILELEMQLLKLDFITDACALPVTDITSNERVGAIISLDPDRPVQQSCLKYIREELGKTLPWYMLPTALRVLGRGEEIPRTLSLKVIRRRAAEVFFPLSDKLEFPVEVEKLDI